MSEFSEKTEKAEYPELAARIERLKKERKAVILAHNYQRPEVQAIADYVGDSLELSRKSAALDGIETIVFCGVDFMAETAKLLAPDRTVLLPEKEAFCPMARMVTAEGLRELKAKHPGVPVVCYVNSSAEVKAECDIACTSANAVEVVESLDADEVIFVPDRALGAWVQRHTKKKIILWNGFCPTHHRIRPEHLQAARKEYPEARLLAHPECEGSILDGADEVASTGGMMRIAREHPGQEFVLATEEGMLHRLREALPEKRFHPLDPSPVCPNMKKTTLEKVLWALEDGKTPVEVPTEIAEKARQTIQRMLSL